MSDERRTGDKRFVDSSFIILHVIVQLYREVQHELW